MRTDFPLDSGFGKRLLRSGLAAAVFTLLLAGPACVGAQDFLTVSKSDAAGHVKTVQAQLTIAAPPAFVWQAMTDYDRLATFMPGYRQSRLVSARGNLKVVDVDLSVARFLPNYHYRVQVQEQPADYHLRFQRISGDFKHMEATYRLSPLDNGSKTVLAYTLHIDPGVSLPGSQQILKANAEASLKALQTRAVQDHRRSLIGKK